jgi:hypothetical protein
MSMRVLCALLLSGLVIGGGIVHGAVPASQGAEVLRNSDIMSLTKASVSGEVIVLKIKASTSQFDTSADAILVLKAGGVADAVIGAMIEASARDSNTPRPAFVPTGSHTNQTKSVITVQAFTAGRDMAWPYDMKQLQIQTVAELKAKDAIRGRFDISADMPVDGTTANYTLDGEVLSWKSGNRATRLLVGMGSGRESAEIRYWLTDDKGAKVFEHRDTIRAEFLGNAYAGSVGQLAHPFASKIGDRLTEAKLALR